MVAPLQMLAKANKFRQEKCGACPHHHRRSVVL